MIFLEKTEKDRNIQFKGIIYKMTASEQSLLTGKNTNVIMKKIHFLGD